MGQKDTRPREEGCRGRKTQEEGPLGESGRNRREDIKVKRDRGESRKNFGYINKNKNYRSYT